MDLTIGVDHKQYLRELIDHYEYILKNPANPIYELHTLVEEEKHKCEYQLRKIKESDIESVLKAKTSLLVFPPTKHT